MSEEFKQVDKFIVTNKILGKGAFGTVYRGFFRDNHSKVVAVKVIPLEKVSTDNKFIKLLKREIEILQKIKHPNIVQMHHATRTTRNLYMFLEYGGDKDLKELLKQRGGKLTESEAVIFFRQICEGFKVIYQNSIIHRDIKPANILINEGKLSITDFGFARCLDSQGMEEQATLTYLGTPLYMAPQILVEEKFSSKCDIWSLGMMFYEMLYGHTPWTGKTPYQLHKNIVEQPLVFPANPPRSDLVKDMLKKMLIIEDEKRISWGELFNHPIIKFDANEISKQLLEIEQTEEDGLLKSAAVNEFYLKKNKVIGREKDANIKAFDLDDQTQNQQNQQVKHNPEEDSKASETAVNSTNSNQPDNSAFDLENILHKQDKEKKIREIVLKLDSYITFERNVGIFVNLTTNLIFRLYKESVLKMQENLFYRIIFLLQKNQLIGFQHLIDVMTQKKQISLFSAQEWDVYKRSQEYIATIRIIKNDNGYIKPYFNEIFGRTSKFMKQFESDPKVAQFYSVLNDNLQKDNADFIKIYDATLVEFMQHIKSSIQDHKKLKRREFLQALKYVSICRNPFILFTWKVEDNADFHEFYDKYDNMNEEDLQKEVMLIYEQLPQ